MSETKFTPGPWFASQWFPDEKADQWAIGLSAFSGCRGDEYLSMSGICREADAHLIAVAPELYEQLKECAETLSYLADFLRDRMIYDAPTISAHDIAAKSIDLLAKARGES